MRSKSGVKREGRPTFLSHAVSVEVKDMCGSERVPTTFSLLVPVTFEVVHVVLPHFSVIPCIIAVSLPRSTPTLTPLLTPPTFLLLEQRDNISW